MIEVARQAKPDAASRKRVSQEIRDAQVHRDDGLARRLAGRRLPKIFHPGMRLCNVNFGAFGGAGVGRGAHGNVGE